MLQLNKMKRLRLENKEKAETAAGRKSRVPRRGEIENPSGHTSSNTRKFEDENNSPVIAKRIRTSRDSPLVERSSSPCDVGNDEGSDNSGAPKYDLQQRSQGTEFAPTRSIVAQSLGLFDESEEEEDEEGECRDEYQPNSVIAPLPATGQLDGTRRSTRLSHITVGRTRNDKIRSSGVVASGGVAAGADDAADMSAYSEPSNDDAGDLAVCTKRPLRSTARRRRAAPTRFLEPSQDEAQWAQLLNSVIPRQRRRRYRQAASQNIDTECDSKPSANTDPGTQTCSFTTLGAGSAVPSSLSTIRNKDQLNDSKSNFGTGESPLQGLVGGSQQSRGCPDSGPSVQTAPDAAEECVVASTSPSVTARRRIRRRTEPKARAVTAACSGDENRVGGEKLLGVENLFGSDQENEESSTDSNCVSDSDPVSDSNSSAPGGGVSSPESDREGTAEVVNKNVWKSLVFEAVQKTGTIIGAAGVPARNYNRRRTSSVKCLLNPKRHHATDATTATVVNKMAQGIQGFERLMEVSQAKTDPSGGEQLQDRVACRLQEADVVTSSGDSSSAFCSDAGATQLQEAVAFSAPGAPASDGDKTEPSTELGHTNIASSSVDETATVGDKECCDLKNSVALKRNRIACDESLFNGDSADESDCSSGGQRRSRKPNSRSTCMDGLNYESDSATSSDEEALQSALAALGDEASQADVESQKQRVAEMQLKLQRRRALSSEVKAQQERHAVLLMLRHLCSNVPLWSAPDLLGRGGGSVAAGPTTGGAPESLPFVALPLPSGAPERREKSAFELRTRWSLDTVAAQRLAAQFKILLQTNSCEADSGIACSYAASGDTSAPRVSSSRDCDKQAVARLRLIAAVEKQWLGIRSGSRDSAASLNRCRAQRLLEAAFPEAVACIGKLVQPSLEESLELVAFCNRSPKLRQWIVAPTDSFRLSLRVETPMSTASALIPASFSQMPKSNRKSRKGVESQNKPSGSPDASGSKLQLHAEANVPGRQQHHAISDTERQVPLSSDTAEPAAAPATEIANSASTNLSSHTAENRQPQRVQRHLAVPPACTDPTEAAQHEPCSAKSDANSASPRVIGAKCIPFIANSSSAVVGNNYLPFCPLDQLKRLENCDNDSSRSSSSCTRPHTITQPPDAEESDLRSCDLLLPAAKYSLDKHDTSAMQSVPIEEASTVVCVETNMERSEDTASSPEVAASTSRSSHDDRKPIPVISDRATGKVESEVASDNAEHKTSATLDTAEVPRSPQQFQQAKISIYFPKPEPPPKENVRTATNGKLDIGRFIDDVASEGSCDNSNPEDDSDCENNGTSKSKAAKCALKSETHGRVRKGNDEPYTNAENGNEEDDEEEEEESHGEFLEGLVVPDGPVGASSGDADPFFDSKAYELHRSQLEEDAQRRYKDLFTMEGLRARQLRRRSSSRNEGNCDGAKLTRRQLARLKAAEDPTKHIDWDKEAANIRRELGLHRIDDQSSSSSESKSDDSGFVSETESLRGSDSSSYSNSVRNNKDHHHLPEPCGESGSLSRGNGEPVTTGFECTNKKLRTNKNRPGGSHEDRSAGVGGNRFLSGDQERKRQHRRAGTTSSSPCENRGRWKPSRLRASAAENHHPGPMSRRSKMTETYRSSSTHLSSCRPVVKKDPSKPEPLGSDGNGLESSRGGHQRPAIPVRYLQHPAFRFSSLNRGPLTLKQCSSANTSRESGPSRPRGQVSSLLTPGQELAAATGNDFAAIAPTDFFDLLRPTVSQNIGATSETPRVQGSIRSTQ